MMTNTLKFAIALFCLMTLSSCMKTKSIKSNSEIRVWNDISEWSFKGKMAINNGKNSGSGRVTWNQNKTTLKASFKAPLGQGSWIITEQENKSELISSTNGTISANNAEALISNELGWFFPWHKIKYWLRGYNSEVNELAQHKILPELIHDSGWEIHFQQWTKTQAGLLPRKIKAIKPPYSVKVIIYDWEIE